MSCCTGAVMWDEEDLWGFARPKLDKEESPLLYYHFTKNTRDSQENGYLSKEYLDYFTHKNGLIAAAAFSFVVMLGGLFVDEDPINIINIGGLGEGLFNNYGYILNDLIY